MLLYKSPSSRRKAMRFSPGGGKVSENQPFTTRNLSVLTRNRDNVDLKVPSELRSSPLLVSLRLMALRHALLFCCMQEAAGGCNGSSRLLLAAGRPSNESHAQKRLVVSPARSSTCIMRTLVPPR